MYPILFSLKGYDVYSYGLFVNIALIATFIASYLLAKKIKLDFSFDSLVEKFLIFFIAGLIVSRISYFIFYRDQFQSWWEIFYIWQAGLTSFGGIIGGTIAVLLIFKKDKWKWLDILGIGFLLGAFFWRIGCFLTGDHPVISSTSWFSINGEFPVILIESVSSLIGFLILLKIWKKKKYTDGVLFFSSLGYYGLVRLIIDSWRLDPVAPLGLHWGQIIGLILVIGSILAIIILKRGKDDQKDMG